VILWIRNRFTARSELIRGDRWSKVAVIVEVRDVQLNPNPRSSMCLPGRRKSHSRKQGSRLKASRALFALSRIISGTTVRASRQG